MPKTLVTTEDAIKSYLLFLSVSHSLLNKRIERFVLYNNESCIVLFRDRKQLVQGAMSCVKVGFDLVSRTQVVIKHLMDFDAKREIGPPREVEMLRRVCKDKIVFVRNDKEDLFVMPYYGWTNLGEVLRDTAVGDGCSRSFFAFKNKLNFDQRRLLALNFAQEMQRIFELGIVHNDLKPEHILVSKKDEFKIKIIDFGCASEIDQHNYSSVPLENRFYKYKGECFYDRDGDLLAIYRIVCLILNSDGWASPANCLKISDFLEQLKILNKGFGFGIFSNQARKDKESDETIQKLRDGMMVVA